MKNKQTRDFLIRNIPLEVYMLLEQSAKEHHRSKTQEALVVLIKGLSHQGLELQRPKPLRWKKKISNRFIQEAIQEGRE